ncbi:SirB1 family protein [Lichenicoccus roseus]|uniref:Tetratricopeptide repeat protein n=1 Tax=Lichenicoccus roseus TaxID=2683649 RepID=A0A5R9JEF1_9PROT|nr:transglutaminase-like domain-containing protein [Lichenicoccus roseus]TLU73786.1 tetratricopeptide repeat protein [Lichenicoccus roseus]
MIEAIQALAAIGLLPDSEIDPAPAALQLARLDETGTDWMSASEHLSELAREAAAIGHLMTGRSAEARIGALAGLLHARYGYRGDSDSYDDLDNANLIKVIGRRKGLPVALGVLWLHCIRAAGWDGFGVDFPYHFLVALSVDDTEDDAEAVVLVDAFGGGDTLDADDLQALLERLGAAPVRLQPDMVRRMTTREVLLRMQRNLVQRRLIAGDVEAALTSLGGMLQIAPDIAANWLNAADLNRQAGNMAAAVACLERFLALVPRGQVADKARADLNALRGRDGQEPLT